MSREKFVDAFELPKDVVLGIPILTIYGTKDIIIENHRGIIYLSSERIAIRVKDSVLVVKGLSLLIKEYTKDTVIIQGELISLAYEN